MTQPVPWGPALKTAPLGHLRRAINRSTRPPERPRWRWPNLWQRRLRGGRCLKSRRLTVCLATTGSTIRTLLHGKINPKDWQVLSLGDAGFLLLFRVVSGDYGKPWTRLLYVLLLVDEVVNIWAHVRTVRLALGLMREHCSVFLGKDWIWTFNHSFLHFNCSDFHDNFAFLMSITSLAA